MSLSTDTANGRRLPPALRKDHTMKKFQIARIFVAVAAIVALAVELGAGHKF